MYNTFKINRYVGLGIIVNLFLCFMNISYASQNIDEKNNVESNNVHKDSGREYTKYTGNVPRIVYDKMMPHGCEPIRDYYKDYFTLGAPFVYDHINGVLFFCESVDLNLKEISYKVVIKHKLFTSCSNEISLESKPEFLALYKQKLKHNVGSISPKILIDVNSDVVEAEGSIVIGQSGNFVTYICFENSWYSKVDD